MSAFPCNLEQFKGMVGEFCKAAPTCAWDSLENGMKAVGLGYLGIIEQDASDIPIAVSYLNFAAKRYWIREHELRATA